MKRTNTLLTRLFELGLNKYEANVYLALIGEGISTAKDVSDITSIPYGKIYEIINSLSTKGFCIILPSKPMKYKAVSPKEAIKAIRENMDHKYKKLEKNLIDELEPLYTQSKKNDSKGVFWIINGRHNITNKINELIIKAENRINICCSSNSLSRLLIHKESLEQAKEKGVSICIAGVMTNEVMEEIKSLNFCDIRKTDSSENNFISVDKKECIIIKAIPDDDNILHGRDIGLWIASQTFTQFIDDLINIKFEKSKKAFNDNS